MKGDLREKFITTTLTRIQYNGWSTTPGIGTNAIFQGFFTWTSELSRPVEVMR